MIELLILAIVIDAICLYNLIKWTSPPNVRIRNIIIIIISAIIVFFIGGYAWYGTWTVTTTDPWGVEGPSQLGVIAICLAPGLLIATVLTRIEDEIIFRKGVKNLWQP